MTKADPIDMTFAALADPTRRQILARLTEGEASISTLAAPHDISMPATLKHIAKLAEAGLITREKRGRTVYCALCPGPLADAAAWLDAQAAAWTARFDALDTVLQEDAE